MSQAEEPTGAGRDRNGRLGGMDGSSRITRIGFAVSAALAVAGLAASAVLAPGLAHERGSGLAVSSAVPVVAPAVYKPTRVVTAPLAAPTWIATLSAGATYAATPGGPAVGSLAATNPFGAPTVLAVIGDPDASGWLHVELPVRPNGSTGWIPSAGVALAQTDYHVAVSLSARTLTVTRGGQTVLATAVAVGAPRTPTPPGNTYLWELIRPDNPNGAYGPYIFGLAWFSDTYSVFNGGDAQIGVHGQDEPWSIGQAVSHGCVRLPNDVITRLAGMLPLGTPVSIS